MSWLYDAPTGKQLETLIDHILGELTGEYRVESREEIEGPALEKWRAERPERWRHMTPPSEWRLTGETIEGEAASHLATRLRDRGWKIRGNHGDFLSMVEEIGFKTVAGRNRRGNHATVVTL